MQIENMYVFIFLFLERKKKRKKYKIFEIKQYEIY